MNTHIKQRGFTLIEGIITIVLLAIAMITLVSFLFPQVERSAVPQYQARSAAMADAIFNEILARQFDQNSNLNGDSVYRCDEKNAQGKSNPCTLPARLGPDDLLEATNPAMANDVDDFIGCWGDTTQCPNTYTYNGNNYVKPSLTSRRGELTDLVPSLSTANYAHIYATINVEDMSESLQTLKKITVSVDAGRYGKYGYIAYRGNY